MSDIFWWMYDRMFKKTNINYSKIRNQNTKQLKSVLGVGTYGITYKNRTKPTNHTRRNGAFKLYYNDLQLKPNPTANYNKARKMANITGNNNQRLQIVKGCKKSDLPNNVTAHLIETGGMPTCNDNSDLPIIRMPYLGINLEDATEDANITRTRDIPISILIIQCYQLMKQIDKIRKKQMRHGDIKIDNIMIHPESGKMTLIDFDLFGNFEGGFYNDLIKVYGEITKLSEIFPPEFICIRAIRDTIVYNRNSNKGNNKAKRIYSFSDFMFGRYMKGRILEFLECINKNEEEGKEYFLESFKSNISLLDGMFKESIKFYDETSKYAGQLMYDTRLINYFMNYFDYYGFGIAMTMFFNKLYPMNKPYHNHSEMDALYEVRALLMSMCDFARVARPEPDTIVKIMEEIMLRNSISTNQEVRIPVATNYAPIAPIATNSVPRIPVAASRAPVTPRKKQTSKKV